MNINLLENNGNKPKQMFCSSAYHFVSHRSNLLCFDLSGMIIRYQCRMNSVTTFRICFIFLTLRHIVSFIFIFVVTYFLILLLLSHNGQLLFFFPAIRSVLIELLGIKNVIDISTLNN